MLKHGGCSEKTHLCNYLSCELNYQVFFHMEHHFYLKEQLIGQTLSSQSCVWWTFSQKWMKWACHFKESNWKYLLPLELSAKKQFRKCVSPPMNLTASQHFNIFLMRCVMMVIFNIVQWNMSMVEKNSITRQTNILQVINARCLKSCID